MVAVQQVTQAQASPPPQQSMNHYGGPILAMTYGDQGYGKTTADAFSFGACAQVIGTPGGLRVAKYVCGSEPQVRQIDRIHDATKLIYEGAAHKNKFLVLLIDDFTLLADRTFSLTERTLSGFDLFKSIRDELLAFRAMISAMSYCHVIVNAHERPPHVDKLSGTYIKGGPKLPGRMPEDLPAAFDVLFRVIPAPWKGQPANSTDGISPLFKLGWPYVFSCNMDPAYITKDKLDLVDGLGPMNLGEMLRARGYFIPRLAHVPWQEDVVEGLTQKFFPLVMQNADISAFTPILSEAKQAIQVKPNILSTDIDCTFRDAIARTWLRVSQATRSLRLYKV